MSRRFPGRHPGSKPRRGKRRQSAEIEQLSADHVSRLAALVACGQASVPKDLDPAVLERLLGEVAQLRRDRLMAYLARAIALDIHRAHEPT